MCRTWLSKSLASQRTRCGSISPRVAGQYLQCSGFSDMHEQAQVWRFGLAVGLHPPHQHQTRTGAVGVHELWLGEAAAPTHCLARLLGEPFVLTWLPFLAYVVTFCDGRTACCERAQNLATSCNPGAPVSLRGAPGHGAFSFRFHVLAHAGAGPLVVRGRVSSLLSGAQNRRHCIFLALGFLLSCQVLKNRRHCIFLALFSLSLGRYWK